MNDQTVDALIVATLGTLGVPTQNLVYTGTADDYINYRLLEQKDTNPADDEPTATEYVFMANIISRHRHKELTRQARKALRAAGFYGIETTAELYENDTGRYHSVIQFNFLEED